MTNQNRDCSRIARCIRRSRFQMLLLSSALHFPCFVSMLVATEAVEPRNSSTTTPLGTTPVLKSVGIRFVHEAPANLDSAKSAATLSGPVYTETAPTVATPKLAIKNESPVMAKESNPSKVILNTVASAPTIKMPPMVASSERKPAAPTPNQTTNVKMEMASITKPLGTFENSPVAKSVSEIKPIRSNANSEVSAPSLATAPAHNLTANAMKSEAPLVASPTAIALPADKALASEPPELESQPNDDDKHSIMMMDKADVSSLSLAPPPSLSPLSPPLTIEPLKPQLPAPAKMPQLASKKNAEENSRAANVVRIPSMTLSSKNLETATVAPSVETPKAVSPESPTPAPKAAIAKAVPKPEAALPVLNSLPSIEEVAHKTETQDKGMLDGQFSPKASVASRISEQAPVIHQPVREASPLEPTVVAIPASTKSSDWDRSVVSGLKPAPLPASQADHETQSIPTSTTVELTYRDAQNIKLPGTIERVVVSDESVCKAMLSDANGMVLLGVGQGRTQIQVWLASTTQSEPRLQLIDVTVREAWEARTPQGVSSYAEATQSLAELFPTAKIAIRSSESGALTIFGRADSDEQAKQIASLVRKMFLVPVQDRIATAPPK